TAEILRVISSSPTDLQRVFVDIAASAARLCNAYDVVIRRLDGDSLPVVAHHGPIPTEATVPLTRGVFIPRVVLDKRTIHAADMQAESHEAPESRKNAPRLGLRTALGVPLIRAGEAIGAIAIRRAEVRPFTDQQIDLLKTFADQAVIAIENTRLFEEVQQKSAALSTANSQLTESLEQQTATSEALRAIGSSPTDVQPVFDTIVRSALRLCDGLFSSLFQFDGSLLHPVSHHNYTPDALEQLHRAYPRPPDRGGGTGRAILNCAIVQIRDVELDPEYQQHVLSRTIGWRSGLFVPMLRDGVPIGVIMVARAASGAFSDNEVKLLKTCADQAVIAIENTRLFEAEQARTREVETKSAELAQSLEYQTATSEVLSVISKSPNDLQPVLDTLVMTAQRLCQ